jgi:hypothetical protein
MRNLSLLVAIFISGLMLIAEADELDYLNEIAAKNGMHYVGLTNGPVGHRSYLFLGKKIRSLSGFPRKFPATVRLICASTQGSFRLEAHGISWTRLHRRR